VNGLPEGTPPYVKVLWSDELLQQIVLRDNDCNRIIVDIGEPGPDGFYVPTLTIDRSDNPLTDYRAVLDEPLPDWPAIVTRPPRRCLGCYVVQRCFEHEQAPQH
jgi:hypothetical protein